MLLSGDIKGLEVVVAGHLSQDKVLIEELLNHVDIHGANQVDVLGLKEKSRENRLVAKRFKFKMIYGGTPGGFAKDPDFQFLHWNKKKWENIKNAYYEKYNGIKHWHDELLDTVIYSGFYESPSGRIYDYRKLLREPDWFYIPKIKNYPVQGFGADIVKIARISLHRRWQPEYGKLVNTIHDSIIVDTPESMCYNITHTMKEVFVDLPENLRRSYKIDWQLPLEVEIKTLDGKEIK
jgi:DNA polymerase I-like protein with 3'-5' exonuclease and polymerase domains